jgi:hypothetical protein
MRIETTEVAYSVSADQMCEGLDLAPRAIAQMVKDGRLKVLLHTRQRMIPLFADARFMESDFQRYRALAGGAEMTAYRREFGRGDRQHRLSDFQRASALGGLLPYVTVGAFDVRAARWSYQN